MKNKSLKSILAIILFSSSLTLNADPIEPEFGSERIRFTKQVAKLRAYYSDPKSSIFLGVGVGAGVITRSANLKGISEKKSGDMSLGLGVNWEVRLGWQEYSTNKQGFRIYASYNQTRVFPGQMATLGLEGLKREYVFVDRITGNIDYLLDLLTESTKRINLYVGVYAGWAESNQKYKEISQSTNQNIAASLVGNNYDSAVIFGFNAGIGVTFARRHRFELGAKIPVLDLKTKEYYEVYTSNSQSSLMEVNTTWMVPTFTFSYALIF